MLKVIFLVLLVCCQTVYSQSWNTSDILPWESYLQLGDIQRPLGLVLDRSSLAHRHFFIGYLCLHSFLYGEAQDAFDLAISINETFIEPYIGKMLGYKETLWDYTYVDLGRSAYNATQTMLNRTGITLTNLQASLLSTVYQWYHSSTTTEGESAFLSSISTLSDRYPNETDIRVLWGLSLLNVANQMRFQSTTEPLQVVLAREVLKNALQSEPNHPGTLHYLIHAYDVLQLNIAQQAEGYAISYGLVVKTASHAQHMPSHIWLRLGSWARGASSDGGAIIASYALCTIKLLNRSVNISSTQLQPYLNLLTSSNQTALLHDCDRENRAHSSEWLAYFSLQLGDWPTNLALVRDLFMADNQSTITPDHYKQFAYRTRARSIIELFFWFPYKNQFVNLTQQILTLNVSQKFVPVNSSMNRWFPIWSDAGWRFSECLRLITTGNMNASTSIVNEHLASMAILANQTSGWNAYVSTSILMMMSQIRGIRYYVSQSWQDCLNELNNGNQLEMTLVPSGNTPSLAFARSSEMLAMHLLLIHQNYQQQSGKSLASMYTLNGTNVSISDFPSRALDLYQQANLSAPNRVINTFGLARANLQMGNNAVATQLYQKLLTQFSSSNNADSVFAQEVLTAITTTTTTNSPPSTTTTTRNNNSAFANTPSFLFLILILCVYFNY